MCAFGVLWLSCGAPEAPKPPGFHTTAREPERAHFRVPAFTNTTKFNEKTPQRDTERAKWWRERGKKSENLGGSAEGGPAEGGPAEGGSGGRRPREPQTSNNHNNHNHNNTKPRTNAARKVGPRRVGPPLPRFRVRVFRVQKIWPKH